MSTIDSESVTPLPELIADSGFTTTDACDLICVAGIQKMNDISNYNVSLSDIIDHAMNKKHHDELHARVIYLDKKISVQAEGKYSAFSEGIETLMFYICYKLKLNGRKVKPMRAGSLYAGLKVGLPLETDYVFLIEDLNDRKLYFSDFIAEVESCIGNIEYIKYNNAQFKFLKKKATRVAYCIILECRNVKNEMREGFSVDIVPASKASDRDRFKIKYRDGAEVFIESCVNRRKHLSYNSVINRTR